MKKKLLFLPALLLSMGITANAEVFEFGDQAKYLTFDGPGFQYFYDSSHYFSDEMARSAKKAVKIVARNDLIADMNVTFNPLNGISHKYNYCVEVYMKCSIETLPPPSIFWICDEGGMYNNRIFFTDTGYTDEKGWRKYEAYVPTGETDMYSDSTTLNMRGYYASDKDCTYYFDDISMRYAPRSIEADDVVADANDYIDLTDVRAYGYDNQGEKQLLKTKGVGVFSLVSGDAKIEQGRFLVPNSKAGTEAVVKLDFCGVSTQFKVTINPSVTSSLSENKVLVDNASIEDVPVSAVFLMTDGENRLYDVKTGGKTVSAASEDTLDIPEFNIPYDMKGKCRIKAVIMANNKIINEFLLEK